MKIPVYPPRPCTRCGVLIEDPPKEDGILSRGDGTSTPCVLCPECQSLSMTDHEAFWKPLRELLDRAQENPT